MNKKNTDSMNSNFFNLFIFYLNFFSNYEAQRMLETFQLTMFAKLNPKKTSSDPVYKISDKNWKILISNF